MDKTLLIFLILVMIYILFKFYNKEDYSNIANINQMLPGRVEYTVPYEYSSDYTATTSFDTHYDAYNYVPASIYGITNDPIYHNHYFRKFDHPTTFLIYNNYNNMIQVTRTKPANCLKFDCNPNYVGNISCFICQK